MLCQSFSILGAEAIKPADAVVQVQPVQRLESSRLFNPVKLELPRARRVGKTEEANSGVLLGACVRPRIRRRALRAPSLDPRTFPNVALRAVRLPLVELGIIVRIRNLGL